jgi:Divergent InlB B-repeat domain
MSAACITTVLCDLRGTAALLVSGVLCAAISMDALSQPRIPEVRSRIAAPAVDVNRLIRLAGGVIVSIDRVDPVIIWQDPDIRIAYSVANFGATPTTGTLQTSLGGVAVKAIQLTVPSKGVSSGSLTIPANSSARVVALNLSFDSRSDCRNVPGPDGRPRPFCATVIHEEDTRNLQILERVGIISSSDAPPTSLPSPDAAVCGSGLYPMNTVNGTRLVPNPKAPWEWAESSGGPAVPVVGRVINTNRDKTKDDIPWSHPFGFDFWFNVAPDSPYRSLLTVAGIPNLADPQAKCSPTPGTALPAACDNVDHAIRPDFDGDACEAFCIERSRGRTPVGALHTEIEEGLIPDAYRPGDDDMVYMRGHHIIDCGHENYTSEIHPPTIVARAHVDSATRGVRSTLIGLPYYTNQRYIGAEAFIGSDQKPFWDHMMSVIAFDALGPSNLAGPLAAIPGLFAPLEALAVIDLTPFKQKIIGKYTISLPPAEGKAAIDVRYHFEMRPGVSVHVTPNQGSVDVVVQMDPATYVPLPPKCTKSAISFETVDEKWTHWLPGTTRVLLNGVLPLIPGAPLSPALLAALNEGGLIMRACEVPGDPPKTPGPASAVSDNQTIVNLAQAYPVYGWLDLFWDSSLVPLAVSRSGKGVVKGPAGIDCGSTCSGSIGKGQSVTLTAQANPGWEFSEWVGNCSGIGGCTIAMNEPQVVTAVFVESGAAAPTHTLSLVLKESTEPGCQGHSAGTVTSVPAGLVCSYLGRDPVACVGHFADGAKVELSAIAGDATNFAGFSGDCAVGVIGHIFGLGAAKTCVLAMNQDRAVTGNFCGLIR